MRKYNIGLDIGTTSVGWAVVEVGAQKIIKKGRSSAGKNFQNSPTNNRKALWGVRLFDSADTAEARRMKRSTRRRYDRRRERVKLLQEEFKDEIDKIDINFYNKLKLSKYSENDIENKKIKLTEVEKNLIKKYNMQYPTIYHLRNKLVESKDKEDIRLVYLAVHHIIKYRGNFNYEGKKFDIESIDINKQFFYVLSNLRDYIYELGIPENISIEQNGIDFESIILKNKGNDLKNILDKYLNNYTNNNNFKKSFINMILGKTFSLKKMFLIESDNDIKISFEQNIDDEKQSKIEEFLTEKNDILIEMKKLYDSISLKKLFGNSKCGNISKLMIDKYENHKKDLKILREIFKTTKYYNDIFQINNCLYGQYIRNKITLEEFCKKILNYIQNVIEDTKKEKLYNKIKLKIENLDFLPRITDINNSIYPYQLNKKELIKIIENQGKYYPFLLEKINDDYKIVKLLEFKIPYYVGPLVSKEKSNFAWLERKQTNVKITPYNFDEVIDKSLTAENFIKRMIRHCTYLLDEYALPTNSILYSKFKVINELKQIKINNIKLANNKELLYKIYEELFLKTPGIITNNKLKKYLYSIKDTSMYGMNITITGYSSDDKFANNMQSYIDFFGTNGIFDNIKYIDIAEQIIEWITIFEDKKILKEKIVQNYSFLTEEQINKILKFQYNGWGNLSKKLLLTKYYKDKRDGVYKSIMDLLLETSENFMQIINNDEYKFQKMIKENNNYSKSDIINYDLVENLATSPATKKGIYQSLLVIKEIVTYMGCEPENIIIEMARTEEKTKKRKDTRKDKLLKIYNEHINDKNLIKKLNKVENLNNLKEYLYYIQEGKCLYSGEAITNLNECDIDHIIPRTLIKDNSIDNLALVYSKYNKEKSASFVVPKSYRKQISWWERLRKIGLISPKKFYNLTREEFKDEDIKQFINRQLVETRQITKHVANILNEIYKKTNVIYLKSSLSHNYREKFELYKYRDLNDYHHAHDAYLAAVIGEYKEKYLKENINFDDLKQLSQVLTDMNLKDEIKYGYVINSFDKNVSNFLCNNIEFDIDKFNKTVELNLYRNDIIISRKTEIRTGEFYKQTILEKGKGKIRIKKNMPVEIYGGYTNLNFAYLTLIECKRKNKIIGVPIINYKTNTVANYLSEILKTKDYKIIKEIIPFNVELKYKNHDVCFTGNSEMMNNHQLKIKKKDMIKYKYLLNYIFNNSTYNLNKETINDLANDLINYLINLKSEYPLYKDKLQMIKDKGIIYDLPLQEKITYIKKIIIMLSAGKTNSDLKDIGLTDREGRIIFSNVEHGCIIFKSVTGIWEDKYEF